MTAFFDFRGGQCKPKNMKFHSCDIKFSLALHSVYKQRINRISEYNSVMPQEKKSSWEYLDPVLSEALQMFT
jgi:hypothetical protein